MFEVLVASNPRPMRSVRHTLLVGAVHASALAVILQVTVMEAASMRGGFGAMTRSILPTPAATVAGSLPVAGSTDYWRIGNRYTDWYRNGHADSLATALHPALRAQLGGFRGVRRSLVAERARTGREVAVIADRYTIDGGIVTVTHEALFEHTGTSVVVLRWTLGPDGEIIAMSAGRIGASLPR